MKKEITSTMDEESQTKKVRRLRIGEGIAIGMSFLLVIIGLFGWYQDDQRDRRQIDELRQAVETLKEDNANQTRLLKESQLSDAERTLLIKCLLFRELGERSGIKCDIEELRRIINSLPVAPVTDTGGGASNNQFQQRPGSQHSTQQPAQQQTPPPTIPCELNAFGVCLQNRTNLPLP